MKRKTIVCITIVIIMLLTTFTGNDKKNSTIRISCRPNASSIPIFVMHEVKL